MAKPVLTDTGERFYKQLAPTFFKEDEKYGWAGARFVSAWAKMFDDAATVVQPLGTAPGFAILFDVENVPAKWLPWLAQFVGIPAAVIEALIQTGQTASAREWIKAPLGYTRGTNTAMQLAARATLTGTKTIYFYARYGGEAFQLKAVTLTSETPTPTATKQAIESMMPAWDVLKYETVAGGTLALLEASHPTLAEVEAAHATTEDMELHPEK